MNSYPCGVGNSIVLGKANPEIAVAGICNATI
jgi:hypothetical protein